MASRDIGVFFRDIIRKAPKFFPSIALLHGLLFLLMLIINFGTKITDYYVEVLWLIGFTVSWLYTCDLKKWAATTYLFLTMANVGLYMYYQYAYDSEYIRGYLQAKYVSTLWLPALVFSFLILFHYRRFNEK